MSGVTLRIANLFLLLALVSGCGSQADSPPPTPAPEKGAPADKAEAKPALPEDVKKGLEKVASVAEQASADGSVLTETGELVSPITSDLSAKFPGRVGKVFVDEGALPTGVRALANLAIEYLNAK